MFMKDVEIPIFKINNNLISIPPTECYLATNPNIRIHEIQVAMLWMLLRPFKLFTAIFLLANFFKQKIFSWGIKICAWLRGKRPVTALALKRCYPRAKIKFETWRNIHENFRVFCKTCHWKWSNFEVSRATVITQNIILEVLNENQLH